MTGPRKVAPESLRNVRELEFTELDWDEFERGVDLFNEGKFWKAHEEWELVWQRQEADERLFLQGLIQLAAAYHQLTQKLNPEGLKRNMEKARAKLEPFSPAYLGVNVRPLVVIAEKAIAEAERLAGDQAASFDIRLIPKLQFKLPNDPDLRAGVLSVLESDVFHEGVRLFNAGYHWEAHEEWEDLWRELEGGEKEFVQGFIQAAAAYSFAKTSRNSSAPYLFGKAIEKLRRFQQVAAEVDIADLATALERSLAGTGGPGVHAPVIKVKR
jgi:predicted metal-dependent hydrolase